MLKSLFITATIVQRTNTGGDLCCPERLAGYVTATFTLLSEEVTTATIKPANRDIFLVGHILSPLRLKGLSSADKAF